MATGAKTVKLELSFKAVSADGVEEAQRVILKTSEEAQGAQLLPQNIAASTTDAAIGLGGVTAAKWVLLEFDSEVLVKLNGAAVGVPMSGANLLQSTSGITSITVTTAAVPVCVQMLAFGT